MISSISDCAVLNNGVRMPWLGLGVWQVDEGREIENAIKYAVKAGYRSIDTAAVYGNEKGVGKAIKACGVDRKELFITTKVWNSQQGYNTTLAAFEESRRRLGLEYIDLYLIHWPVRGKYKETWRAMEKLYNDGVVRAIGVSNFHVHHLKDLMSSAAVIPMVNQVEFHPMLAQNDLRSFCRENSIQFEAWSPLMQGRLNNPVLDELAKKYDRTPAQIILRWDLQNEVITIPKSVRESRIIENSNIFDFVLEEEDMKRIDGLNANRRFGPDPDNFFF